MDKKSNLQLAKEDANQAQVYLEAVRRLVGANGNFISDLEMLHPASFLLAHAIELSLNAYLRASKAKSHLSGHELLRRLTKAEEIGFIPTNEFRKCIIAIDDAHRGMQFRYSRSNPAAFVTPSEALKMVEHDIENIERYVAAQLISEV